MDDGFDRLMGALDRDGAGALPLPGLDDPMPSGEYVRLILGEARERGWEFEDAWPSALNRLQPPIIGGAIEIETAQAMYEDRALLEETRPHWQAAYEQREPTARERAQCVVSSWGREQAGRIPAVARRKEAA